MKRKQNGFAMAVTMALLPLLISAVLATFGIVSFAQADLRLKYICRSENIATATRVAKLLQSLLSMNPTARRLQAELIAATASCEATGASCAELVRIKAVIAIFKAKQQMLITQANLILQQGHQKAFAKISREGRGLVNAIPLFQGQIRVSPGFAPLLAVRPEIMAEPPTYSPVENFSDRQALEHHWQYHLITSQPLRNFLNQNFQFDKDCSVSLKQDGDEWVPQIKTAKSLLKWP